MQRRIDWPEARSRKELLLNEKENRSSGVAGGGGKKVFAQKKHVSIEKKKPLFLRKWGCLRKRRRDQVDSQSDEKRNKLVLRLLKKTKE